MCINVIDRGGQIFVVLYKFARSRERTPAFLNPPPPPPPPPPEKNIYCMGKILAKYECKFVTLLIVAFPQGVNTVENMIIALCADVFLTFSSDNQATN